MHSGQRDSASECAEAESRGLPAPGVHSSSATPNRSARPPTTSARPSVGSSRDNPGTAPQVNALKPAKGSAPVFAPTFLTPLSSVTAATSHLDGTGNSYLSVTDCCWSELESGDID